jgi:hypothetical protein
MGRLALCVSLFAGAAVLFAQSTRGDIKIFIPRPISNTGINEQQDFFAEQFNLSHDRSHDTMTYNS